MITDHKELSIEQRDQIMRGMQAFEELQERINAGMVEVLAHELDVLPGAVADVIRDGQSAHLTDREAEFVLNRANRAKEAREALQDSRPTAIAKKVGTTVAVVYQVWRNNG